jgi:hypothetical protein
MRESVHADYFKDSIGVASRATPQNNETAFAKAKYDLTGFCVLDQQFEFGCVPIEVVVQQLPFGFVPILYVGTLEWTAGLKNLIRTLGNNRPNDLAVSVFRLFHSDNEMLQLPSTSLSHNRHSFLPKPARCIQGLD